MAVSAVFHAHPLLRIGVQLAGGLYLVYLGVKLWRLRAARLRQACRCRPGATGEVAGARG